MIESKESPTANKTERGERKQECARLEEGSETRGSRGGMRAEGGDQGGDGQGIGGLWMNGWWEQRAMGDAQSHTRVYHGTQAGGWQEGTSSHEVKPT